MYSFVIIFALPIAATRISARLHTPGRSCVLEWQTVTVAFSPRSSMDMGFPTTMERPMTTASLPLIGT